ncbi:MAG TPA: hypothetical protein VGF14_07165 [Alphaproteobacteria bacterium]
MKYNYLLVIAILSYLLSCCISQAHADMSSADALILGDVNVDNRGDALIAVGSAVGNIGSGVHTSATMGGLDVDNGGHLELAVGSVVSNGAPISNVKTSANVGHLRINNGGNLKLAIGSIAP